MTYRTGNHQPRNIYRGDEFIGVCTDADPDWALSLVSRLNTGIPGRWHEVIIAPSRPQDLLIPGGRRIAVFFDPEDARIVAEALEGDRDV